MRTSGPQVTVCRREVGRPDEEAIHALDRRDLGSVGDAGAALDLHDHRDLVVDAGKIVGHRAVAVAALGDRDAAHALRRIARIVKKINEIKAI